MEMEDQYNIADLRQLISRAAAAAPPPVAQFPPYPPPPDLFSSHPSTQHYDMVSVMGRHVTSAALDIVPRGPGSGSGYYHHHQHHQDHFNSDSTTTTATAVTNSGGFDGGGGGDGGSARWPRQETLTLLEVRSKLDHKFKEANQKGPLWDEVARIMLEEHGYQRSGKKCREKFENLYKYYKKTKEGKAGRQDGKHYRFFRQLEALYGDHTSSAHHHHHHQTSTSDPYIPINTPHFHNNPISPQLPNMTSIVPTSGGCDQNSASLTISSSDEDYATSSSEEEGASLEKKKSRGSSKKRSWKAKIKEFIDVQMTKIMEKQEIWLEKMTKTLEKREQERVEREEEWRKQEVERVEREHKFWARERAWIEARDSALMKALDKLTKNGNGDGDGDGNGDGGDHQWAEVEVTRLIQLRTNMEARFQQCGFSEEVLWEDIAAKMAYFGHERSAIACKEKWDGINKSLEERKGRKERLNNNNYGGIMVSSSNHNGHNQGGGGLYMNHHQQQGDGFNNSNSNNHNHNHNHNNGEVNESRLELKEESSSPSSHNSNINVNGGNMMNDSCLRFFLGGDAENLGGWETSYGVKAQQG